MQDGYPVSFDCVVIGKPLPTVRWFKDGKVLEEDDHYMINEDQEGCHQLIITAVVPTDMGVYRCLAENSMGVASTKAELRVDRESLEITKKTQRVKIVMGEGVNSNNLLILMIHGCMFILNHPRVPPVGFLTNFYWDVVLLIKIELK